ncbi:MAG: DNA polymerase III subunit beta [Clostridiales bacterium]|nr:DNA polymerase III subunit beta [Clostridiales bacterium]
MKLSMDKNILLENLNVVGKVVPSRTTKQILECILITAEEGGVKLFANNLELGIETAKIAASVAQPGGVALDAKMFIDIVRKMPGDLIQIDSDYSNVTRIKSERSEFKILGQPAEEFPMLPVVEKDREYAVRASDFKEMIHQTIFAVAITDAKPVLTGELLQVQGKALHLVAVDGYRIAYRKAADENLRDDDSINVVIPAKSLSELGRILPSDGEDALRFHFTDKHILFELLNYTLISRLLEGDFIRYSQIFNEDFNSYVCIQRSLLLTSLERASLIAKEDKKVPVKLSIGHDNIIITSSTELGTSYDEVPADIDGVTLDIAFNPKFLIDALRVIADEEIIITFTGSLSPCIIKGRDNDSYKYLILPLRLKS